jgi:arginine exporter protein ArgO
MPIPLASRPQFPCTNTTTSATWNQLLSLLNCHILLRHTQTDLILRLFNVAVSIVMLI